MDARTLELADELCGMVGSDDLLSWLGLSAGSSGEEAKAALKKKRSFFQSMQGNPKYRDAAKHFIKHARAFDALLSDPAAYAAHARKHKAHAQLPMLEMAIDSVLADGVLSAEEEAFVRESAMNLGISSEMFEMVLRERCEAAGVALPKGPPPPPTSVGGARSLIPGMATAEMARPKPKAAAQGWWDDSFRSLLLQVVPEDTRRLVDFATGQAWGALTLLPERPQLEYLGLDQDVERLQLAERAIRHSPVGNRLALMPVPPQSLPIPDGAVDVVLCIRALDRQPEPDRVIAEAARVLRPGGRLVVVEPDHASMQVWFDGRQVELEAALTALAQAVDEALGEGRDPAEAPSVSMGPTLGARVRRVGLRPAEVHVHALQYARFQDVESFAERLSSHIRRMAQLGRLGARAPEVLVAMSALDRLETRAGTFPGQAATVVPTFVVVGIKQEA